MDRRLPRSASQGTAWLSCALFIVGLVFWGGILEGAARWWVRRHGDALDQSMALLRADRELGWRQRARFRSEFMGVHVETDERGLRNPPAVRQAKGPLIIILGPSSTFGWGVAEEATYPRQLERLLRQTPGHATVSVLNAGQVGFSSWQGLRFFERELQQLHPAVLVIAYGVNDMDRHRFLRNGPFSDQVEFASVQPVLTGAMERLTDHFMVCHVLRRQAARWLTMAACLAGGRARVWAWSFPGLRVLPQDYQRNLEELTRLAKREGIRVIHVTSGFALARSSPSAAERCEGDYRVGAAYAAGRRCREAAAAMARARALEPWRLDRDLRVYNEMMRDVARRSADGLIDLEGLGDDPQAPTWFLDAVHFTAEGHARVAEALRATVLQQQLLN